MIPESLYNPLAIYDATCQLLHRNPLFAVGPRTAPPVSAV